MLSDATGAAAPPPSVSCPGCAESLPSHAQFCPRCGTAAPTPLLPGPRLLKSTLSSASPPVDAAPTYVFEGTPATADAPRWLSYELVAFGTRSHLLQLELGDDGHPRVEGDEAASRAYEATASVRVSRPAGSAPAATQTLFSRAPTRTVLGGGRLVVVVLGATTLLGPSEPAARTVFCLSVPLETVGAVTLERTRRRRGRHDDTAVVLSGSRDEPSTIRFESIVGSRVPGADADPDVEGTSLTARAIFDQLVRAAVTSRRARGNDHDPLLAAAERGHVEEIGDDLVAVLAADHRGAV